MTYLLTMLFVLKFDLTCCEAFMRALCTQTEQQWHTKINAVRVKALILKDIQIEKDLNNSNNSIMHMLHSSSVSSCPVLSLAIN